MKLVRPGFPQVLGLQKDPVSRAGAPVSFSATNDGFLTPQGQNLNASALQSGYRGAYYVDEIRIAVSSNEQNANTVDFFGAIAYPVLASFRLGNDKFSNQPIPVPLLAPDWIGSGFGDTLYTRLVDTVLYYQEVRWPLPKPLYIAPGDGIQAYVQMDARSGSVLVSNSVRLQVTVTYIGRTIAPGTPVPATRSVPWVSHMYLNSANAEARSNMQFQNPFMVPLQAQRFVTRLYAIGTGGTVFTEIVVGNALPGSGYWGSSDQYPTIEVSDSMGYKMTQTRGSTMMPLFDAFDPQRFDWNFNRPLGPREQYNVVLGVGGNTPQADTTFDSVVSMIGHREASL